MSVDAACRTVNRPAAQLGGHWEGRNNRGGLNHGHDNRIWYYDGETDRWIDRDIEPAPSERYWINLAFDPSSSRMILSPIHR